VTIPPLRERPGDISAIARHALGCTLSPELETLLLASSWPGNVTELKASLLTLRPLAGGGDRAAHGCLVEVASLLLGIEEGRESSMKEAITRLSRKLATHALCRTDGSITQAAQLLGLTRNSLRWHLRKVPPPS
jgi:DNA-binding NtrC family response regulator